MRRSRGWCALLLCAVLHEASAAPPLDMKSCRGPDQVRSIDVAPAALLASPLHRVAPCATLRGNLYEFALDTPYGPLNAASLELLALRVEELPALDRAEKTTRSAAYRGAATKAGANALKALGNVLLHPIDSVVGLPRGVWRFVRTESSRYRERARELKDKARKDDEAAAQTPIPGSDGATQPESPWYARGGRKAQSLMLGRVGYNKARREWAKQLEVDPYTRNPLLNDRLDDLAWAALAGGRTVSFAIAATGGVSSALGYVRRIDSLVWDASPEEVAVVNRRRLDELQCDGPQASYLLANGHYTPTLETQLVDALIALKPDSGCADFLALAGSVQTEVEARFLIHALEMLPPRIGNDERDHNLQMIGGGFALVLGSGPRASLLLALPVDRLQWNDATGAFFDSPEFRLRDKTALIGGDAERRARRGLTKRGFSIVENVKFPGRVERQ